MLRLTSTLAILLLLGLAAHASAQAPATQAPPSSLDQEARTLFDAGSLAYGEGRYANALEYFRRAHELSGRPQLLYNIAVAAERLRYDAEALAAYREYLAQVPDSDQRAAVEARIAILEAAIAENPPSQADPSAPESGTTADVEGTTALAPSASPDVTGPIVLIASGGAVALVGGILLGIAVGDDSAVENAPQGARWSTVSEAYSRVDSMFVAGGVALGVGVAAAIGGLVWIAIPSEEPSAAASFTVVPGIGTAAVRGSF